MSLVSVVIPVFNGEKTIAATIKSVLQQTYTNFEIIVINDGSEDRTLEIIKQITDPRIKVFSFVNAGLAASRNRGIKNAQGEFIAFLDADDLWTKNKLEKQLEALQNNPQATVAYSWTDYIDEAGNFLYPGCHITANENIYEQLLVKNILENGSNPLIRSSALVEIGGFDESLNKAEDLDLYLRLAAKYNFISVRLPQILYRLSANSMSASVWEQEAQCLVVIERAFNQAPETLQHLKKNALARLYEYLMFRILASKPQRQQFFQAAKYFWQMIRYDPSVLQRRTKLMTIVCGKIILGAVSPKQG